MRVLSVYMMDSIDYLGRQLLGFLQFSSQVFLMMYLSFRAVLFDKTQGLRAIFSVISAQIYFTGWQAVPLISALGIASGSVVIMQSSTQLSLLGGQDMIGGLLVAIIVREVGPLLTALIVIARSGTAVASEIGTMKVNNEIVALESMGINPLSYIVFPRIVGGVISVLCLSFYFIIVALMGGFLITKLVHNLSFNFYLDSIAKSFEAADLFLFLVKNLFSGSIIFVVSCYQGFQVQRSPNEVPQVTTKAVVQTIIYVTLFNLITTTLFYLNKLVNFGVL